MPPKLFTIVTPTLNCGSKIERTIESVLSQKRELFEYIIVDGGSTDDTLQTIARFKNELTLISEPDTGVYDAMNKGIEMSNGEYLYFIGAGDLLKSDVLETMRPALPPSGLNVVYGNAYFVSYKEVHSGKINAAFFRTSNVCHQAIFYQRTIFELLGNFNLKYKILADWAFNLKCFGDKRIRQTYIAQLIADYEGGGISERYVDTAFHADHKKLIRRYLGLRQYLLYNRDVAKKYWKSLSNVRARTLTRIVKLRANSKQ